MKKRDCKKGTKEVDDALESSHRIVELAANVVSTLMHMKSERERKTEGKKKKMRRGVK